MDRRTFVGGFGAVAAISCAGCLGGGDDDDGEGDDGDDDPEDDVTLSDPPAYAKWIDTSAPGNSLLYTDFSRIDQVEAYEPFLEGIEHGGGHGHGSHGPDVSGVAESVPTNAGEFVAVFLEFAPYHFPFFDGADLAGVSEGDGDDSSAILSIDAIAIVDDVTVVTGEVDQTRLGSHRFVSTVDTAAEYTIYESQSLVSDEPIPFAATDGELVLPVVSTGPSAPTRSEMRSTIDAALDTATAELFRADEDLAWLIDRCGSGAFALGAFGTAIQPDIEETQEREHGTDADAENGDGAGDNSDNSDDNVGDEHGNNDDTEGGSDDVDGTAEDGDDGDSDGPVLDPFEQFEAILSRAVGVLMVADKHDRGRQTRTGIAFESAEAIPDVQVLRDSISDGASDVEVETVNNRVVVEAVWN